MTKAQLEYDVEFRGETMELRQFAINWLLFHLPHYRKEAPTKDRIRKAMMTMDRRLEKVDAAGAFAVPPGVALQFPNTKIQKDLIKSRKRKSTRSLGEIRSVLYADPWPSEPMATLGLAGSVNNHKYI